MTTTSRTYKVSYRDKDDACPVFTWRCKADCSEDALEQFRSDGDDWLVLSVEAA